MRQIGHKPGHAKYEQEKKIMKTRARSRRYYLWACLDGEKLVEVILAALDNNMTVDDMKKKLIEENPGHEITFKSSR